MSAQSGGNKEVLSPSNLELLYNVTIKNPQYRASDFFQNQQVTKLILKILTCLLLPVAQ